MMHIIGLNEAALRCIQLLGVTPLRGKKTQGSEAGGGVVEKKIFRANQGHRFQQS